MMKLTFTAFLLWITTGLMAQPGANYWQQHVAYEMEIDMHEAQNQFTGKQKLTYTNHSPDTLYQVYYHLYFNAFQPNSMMDVRSRTILDPDRRVRDRIQHLKDDEIGYQKINTFTQNGKAVTFKVEDTVLEATLPEPILPGETAVFEMDFQAQIPLQIRRSGRDNAEGVRFSMTQWYPKMAEYDKTGWNPNPYIGREFFAPYGSFDIKITIDSAFTLGGTGILQNANEIGHGYAPVSEVQRPAGNRLTWHFTADNVHDFGFAADPNYTHYVVKGPNNLDVHTLFKTGKNAQNWMKLGDYTAKAIGYMNEHFGVYPYQQYTVIQGGDGGMEYPMATLITGGRNLGSLVGVMAHELAHNWYYGILGFNESVYPWMDEGFTEYASSEVMAHLFDQKGDPHSRAYGSYLSLKYRGMEEPLTTHADQYETNFAYSVAAYTTGHIFLNQLSYIVGYNVLRKSLLRFFDEWKFKHPDAEDLVRIVEKESGMVLDWYLDHWIRSVRTIDYGIKEVQNLSATKTAVQLQRIGNHYMPVDLYVEYSDKSFDFYTIPLVSMRGEKRFEGDIVYTVAKDWPWTNPDYYLEIDHSSNKQIKRIEIDPTLRMADVNRLNNEWPFPNETKFMEPISPAWNSYSSSWRPQLWYGEFAGPMFGFRSYGSYIFNQYAYKFSMRVTGGELSNYSTSKTDLDYDFQFSKPAKYFGKSATFAGQSKRYFGVLHNQLSFEKYLGEYGMMTKERKRMEATLFYQQKTADRTVGSFRAWDRSAIFGSRIAFEEGTANTNGTLLKIQLASSGSSFGASYLSYTANKTFYSTRRTFSTRIGFTAAAGVRSMPVQYRFRGSGSTLEEQWNNTTWFEFANIHTDLTANYHFNPAGKNGLAGYGLPGIGSPDVAGNNRFTAVVWNEWTPFTGKYTRLTTFELSGAIGKSWNGAFFADFPFADDSPNKILLASLTAGMSYNASFLPVLSKWRAQSDFLNNLKLTLRMPFYMNGLQGRSNFNSFLLFGVSNSF